MANTSLSTAKIKTLKQSGLHSDGDGLYLNVKFTGKKSWIFRYMLNGRRRDMGLGSADILSLAEARVSASEQRKLLLDNIDPIEHRKARIKAKQQAESKAQREGVTFEQCANEYIATKSSEWSNTKHAQQWTSTLVKYAYPTIGKRRLGDIDQDAILSCLQPIWNAKTETATRVRQRIESIIDFGKAKGHYIADSGNAA